MPKTAELTGAHLAYWVAKAEGLTLCEHQDWCDSVQIGTWPRVEWYDPRQWGVCGPLIEKHRMCIDGGNSHDKGWYAATGPDNMAVCAHGATPQEAICRAVVRAAFGDEVPEVAPC